MMKLIAFLTVLACAGCNPAWAGLPPTTIKGQTGSKATTFNFQVPANQATVTGAATALIETGNGNLLANPGFEAQSVASGWTISNGTPTGDTSTEFDGLKALSLAFTSVNGNLFEQSISDCDKYVGQNLEATIYLKTSTSNLEVCTFLGSNELQCSEVATTNVWQPYTFNIAPSSGQACTIRVRTTTSTTGSLGADAAYLGLARSIGTVAQAQTRVFSSRITSNQTISTTNETTLVYNANSGDYFDSYGELNTSTGVWTSKFTGRVIVDVTGSIASGAAEQFVFRLRKDGISGTSLCAWVGAGNTNQFPFAIAGCAVDVVLGTTLQVTSDSTSDASYDFASGATAAFRVVSVPTQSELAIRPADAAFMVDANISGANPDLGTSAVSSYTEITNGSLTLTPASGSAPVGIMCSSTNSAATPSTSPTTCSAGSESVGFNVDVPKAGVYEVCAYFAHGVSVNSGAGVSAAFQWVQTPTNAQTNTALGGTRLNSGYNALTVAGVTGGATSLMPQTNCAIFSLASSGVTGFRLMYEQSVTSSPSSNVLVADSSASVGQRDIRITMRPWLGNANAPLLVGSVTSNYQGLVKLQSATTSNINCQTFSFNPGSWISYTSKPGTGNCNFAITGFSARPSCQVTVYADGAGDRVCKVKSGTTSTNLEVQCTANGTDTDMLMEINCFGI